MRIYWFIAVMFSGLAMAAGPCAAQEDDYEAGQQAFHNNSGRPDTSVDAYSGYLDAEHEAEVQRKNLEEAMHPHVTPPAPSYSYQAPAQQQSPPDAQGSVPAPGGLGALPKMDSPEPDGAAAAPKVGSLEPPAPSKPADVRPPVPARRKPYYAAIRPRYRQCPPWGCGPNVPLIMPAIVFNGIFNALAHGGHRHW